MPAADIAFSDEELRHLFAGLTSYGKLLVAVSGGGDSLALLDLLVRWRGSSAANFLSVATVDHGLRREAREEARFVARRCAAYGVSHRILTWRGEKPTTAIQAVARKARYGLLKREMTRVKAEGIITAHTADDQAETVLMRLAKGSGLRGLSGMRDVSLMDGALVLRPLLEVRGTRLRAHLEGQGLSWRDDPSNQDMRYLRPRLRRAMEALAGEGLGVEGLVKVARKLARADRAVERFVDELQGLEEADGRLAMMNYKKMPAEVRLRYLARLVRRYGAGEFAPADHALEALDRALCRAEGGKLRRTLGHAIISAGPRYLRASPEKRGGALGKL